MNPKPSEMNKFFPSEIGYVTSNRDFLVYLDGFPSIRIGDIVQSNEGIRGWVNSLGKSKVEVLMLDEGKIYLKQQFRRLESRLGIAVGDFLIGRAVNPLGVPIDGKGLLSHSKSTQILELEQPAPGIQYRKFITEQFITGITLIDNLIPLGRGQRELVMGDAHSGKTSFLTDLIISQKGTGTICIYAAIGKPSVTIRNLIDVLKANNAFEYTILIGSSASELAPLIFLTPQSALSAAEYFQRQGRNVLVILDDLGTHAKIYREISLLGNKSPGRESYPGDIFYQHAHLLERAGSFNQSIGGGSITALPVIELNLSDFTTLIPTNLMSMTDGHLLFRSSLHSQGQRPAVDLSLSVSRVGRQTQSPCVSAVSQRVRQLLSAASDLETVSRFSSELSPQTQLILRQKDMIMEILKQELSFVIPPQVQAAILTLPFTTFLQNKTKAHVVKFKNLLIQAFMQNPKLKEVTQIIPSLKDDFELISKLETVVPILEKLCQG